MMFRVFRPIDIFSIFAMSHPRWTGVFPAAITHMHADQSIDLDATARHFEALIVSDQFEGKRSVQRHQLVYAALGDRMREEIHALSMRTMTPAERSSRTSS